MVRVVAILTISLAVACTVLYRCYGVCIYSFFVVFMSRKPTFRKSLSYRKACYLIITQEHIIPKLGEEVPRDLPSHDENTGKEV